MPFDDLTTHEAPKTLAVTDGFTTACGRGGGSSKVGGARGSCGWSTSCGANGGTRGSGGGGGSGYCCVSSGSDTTGSGDAGAGVGVGSWPATPTSGGTKSLEDKLQAKT